MDKIVIALFVILALAIGLIRMRYGKSERLAAFILATSLPAWLYLFWL